MDIPIELFLGFIGVSIALAIFGFLRNPQIPATIVMGGMFILLIAVATTNVTLGDNISSVNFVPQNITFTDAVNSTQFRYDVESITMQIAINNVNKIVAEYASPTSVLNNEEIRCISYLMAKQGTPTGTVDIGIFNSSGILTTSFGSFLIQSLPTVPNNPLSYQTFCRSDNYVIQPNDRIGVQYTNGSATNFLALREDLTNPFDGTNTFRQVFTTSWVNATSNDVTAKFYSTNDENIELTFESNSDVYNYECNCYEFTELPKTLFALIGVMMMLIGGLMVMRD
jgi:hypothetical protein